MNLASRLWSRLSSRDRRALMWGAGVVLFALLHVFVVRPTWARRALTSDVLAVERDLLAREQAAVASAREPGTNASNAANSGTMFFVGADDVMTTSALAEYVSAMASGTDVQVLQAVTRSAMPSAAGLRRLQVEVRTEGDLTALLEWLERLDAGPRRVFVERADVAPAASTGDGARPLLLSATVTAFAVVDAGAARDLTAKPSANEQAYDIPLDDVRTEAVARAAARDPFFPDRRAPSVPYRSRAEQRATAEIAGMDERSGYAGAAMLLPEVHGTAVDARGEGFAMVSLPGGPVVVVRVGDLLDRFTVLAIERARVLFRDAAGKRHLVDATTLSDSATQLPATR